MNGFAALKRFAFILGTGGLEGLIGGLPGLSTREVSSGPAFQRQVLRLPRGESQHADLAGVAPGAHDAFEADGAGGEAG